MIERNLTREQLAEVTRRHCARIVTVPYQSPMWGRMCRIRWRLYNAELEMNNEYQ